MSSIPKASTSPPTPILDLSAPLGNRCRNTPMSGFGVALVTVASGLLLALVVGRGASRTLGTAYVLLSFVICLFCAVLVHELGHLLTGWIVGFHFGSIDVGPISLISEHGRLKVQARREMLVAGSVSLQIGQIRRVRHRLLLVTVAGPTANLLSLVAVVILVNSVFPTLGDSWFSVPSAQFAVISLLLALVNLMPLRIRGFISDGSRIAMLMTSPMQTRRWITIAALSNQHRRGKDSKLWNRHWTEAASAVRDNSTEELAANFLAYTAASSRDGANAAAAHLERCLELTSLSGRSTRDVLCLEAAVFTAWFRNDAEKAERWLSLIEKPKLIPQLLHLRGAVALECAQNNFGSALLALQEAMKIIEDLPAESSRIMLRNSWLEWRGEIVQRSERKVNESEG